MDKQQKVELLQYETQCKYLAGGLSELISRVESFERLIEVVRRLVQVIGLDLDIIP